MIPAVARSKTELAVRNSVRIIGGGWRGRRIEFPGLPGLRPTPARVRETLFNWLQQDIVGARCLDLFAGSGALGLEALSRGAAEVVFVEHAAAAARNLQRLFALLGAEPRARLAPLDAARYLAGPAQPFDIVFLDPPFGEGALDLVVPRLAAGGWLGGQGLVYLEGERTRGVPRLPSHWELLKSKSAGEVGYHLARVKGG